MAFEIILIPNDVSDYWTSGESVPHSSIRFQEWSDFFFGELKVSTYDEYTARKLEGSEDFDIYLKTEFSRISQTFPMLGRIDDYYRDARFAANELNALQNECKSLLSQKMDSKAGGFLQKINDACSLAIEKSSGLLFSAD